jgi:hypothetical protein
MAGTMSTSLDPRLLEPGLAKVTMGAANRPSYYQKLTDDTSWKKSPVKSSYRSHKVVPLGPMRQRGELTGVGFDTGAPGEYVEISYVNYALGIRISENMFEDEMYGVIEKYAATMGRSARLTKDLIVASFYDTAFSTTSRWLSPDSTSSSPIPLISASHRSFGGGAVRTNTTAVSSAIGFSSLKELRLVRRTQLDDRGYADPNVTETTRLLIHANAEDDVDFLTNPQSKYDPDSNKNGVNVLTSRTKWQIVVNEFLTSTTQWFMMDPDQTGVLFIQRQGLKTNMRVDEDNFSSIYTIRDRWGLGIETWEYVYGSGN